MDRQALSTSFHRRSSIRTKLQVIIITLVFLSTIIVSIVAMKSVHQSYQSLNDMVNVSLMDVFRESVTDDVDIMETILNSYTKDIKNQKIPPETQEQIKNIIRSAHYDKEGENWIGYYFLYDLNGTVLAHGNDAMLEGKNLLNMKDPNGQLIIKKLRDAAIKGGGYVEYLWNKPTDLVGRYKKISYARMIDNTSWWIGTGVYVDYIDKTIARMHEKQEALLKRLLIQYSLLLCALIILSLLIAFYFGARLSKPIISLSKVAKRIASGDYNARAEVKRDDELGDMAKSFNEMADSINEKVKDLIHKEQYTAKLLESIPDGLIVTDKKNKIVQVNPAAEKILGFNKDELIGQKTDIIIPKKFQKEYQSQVLDPVLQGKTFTNEVKRNKKDGTEISLVVTVAPVIETDKMIRYRIHSFTDVTEQNKLKFQVKQMEGLKKYFPKQIVDQLMDSSSDINLGYDRKKVTIFFSDLVNFTDLSDSMEAEEIVTILREYFTAMGDIVYRYSGTLDKFIGDGLMVFFGAPSTLGVKEDALNCLNMALDMQEKLEELNSKWKLSMPIKMRIGINTGFVTVGNFGSDIRLEYTVIGMPVNIASRLEHQAVPGSILISYDTAQQVKDNFVLEEREPIKLKGIHQPIKAFAVIGRMEGAFQQ